MDKKAKKGLIGIAMAAIMIASVLVAMVPSGSANPGDTHRVINTVGAAGISVLIGQKLNFDPLVIPAGTPIAGFTPEAIEGLSFGTTSTNYNTKSYMTTAGVYWVDSDGDGDGGNPDLGRDAGDTYLAVASPTMDLALKVLGDSVSSITEGTLLEIDFSNNLFETDTVDLKIIDPKDKTIKFNPQLPAPPAADSQDFDDINVSYLVNTYGVTTAHILGIDTTGWDLGGYTFQIETEDDMACGLDMASNELTLTIIKSEIAVEAEKTSGSELETIGLTVTGTTGHNVTIATSDAVHTTFEEGMEDNKDIVDGNLADGNMHDTIDADGVRKYVVEFTDTGTYTITVTDTTAVPNIDDTVDITISEKAVTFEMESVCIIGEDITVIGHSNTGNYVDIAFEDIIVKANIAIEADGSFEEDLATPATYGTGTPGSVRIEAFIDGRWNAVDEGVTDISAFDDDGSTVILMAEPTLAVEVSVVSVAQDDDFYVRGTAPGTDNVDILTLAPKGGGGKGMSAAGTVIPLVPGYVTRAGTVPGLYGATSGVTEVDYTYEKKIDVDDDADTGTYLVGVLSPGRDGIYNGVGEPSATLIAGIVRDYCGGNAGLLASKTTEQFINILLDATKGAAGSDDLVEVTFIKVESPFVEIGPIADVPIGTDLVVTGTSNRKEGFSIVVTVKAPGTELSPATALIENGTFSATFDTSTATEGRYTVKADDGDGHTDEATVTLVTGVPTPPTEVTPTPEEVTPTPPTEVTPPAEVTPTPEESPEVPPEETPKPPGFEAVFAIAGLLAVAYLVLRRKK